jgi:WhiB family redox-sensing transcriptional regulator
VRWQEHAACRGLDPAEAMRIFFVGVGEGQDEAMSYCVRCPVRQECLDDALARPGIGDHGVRGGTSERQRRRLRAERAATTGLPERRCQHCDEPFTPHNRVQRYCTDVCTKRASQAAYAKRQRDERRWAS